MHNIFVTGGAGFLGRGILRYARSEYPDLSFTIFSRDHGKHSKVAQEFPNCRFIIGDIKDIDRLTAAMAGADTVIHAAAFKYVPQAETNSIECTRINIIGSCNVAEAAISNRVGQVIGISTDKAGQPVNVYGSTKWMMERLFQEYDTYTNTRFKLVRYGNVISSTGSVVPIFQEQLRKNRTVTLTDPHMTRFWLDIDQAVRLVFMAMMNDRGGTVLIPRLGSMGMADLVRTIAVNEDILDYTVQDIGRRLGEKTHEDLLTDIEAKCARWYPVKLGDIKVMELYHPKAAIESEIPAGYSSGQPDIQLDLRWMLEAIQKAGQ